MKTPIMKIHSYENSQIPQHIFFPKPIKHL